MHTAFALRPLTAQDEPFLWEMLYQAIYVPPGQPPPDRGLLREPALARYVADWGQRQGDLGFTGLDPHDQQPVGAAWLRLFTAREPGFGYVAADIPELSIAILPAWRGQGLGTQLIQATLGEAAQQAAALHWSAVSLSVSRDNPAARLYRRLGFEVFSAHDESLTMLKRLG
jgi:ribosomal protein S18 acetylase RimI-like enzyme